MTLHDTRLGATRVRVPFSLPRTLADIRTPSGYSSSTSTRIECGDHPFLDQPFFQAGSDDSQARFYTLFGQAVQLSGDQG